MRRHRIGTAVAHRPDPTDSKPQARVATPDYALTAASRCRSSSPTSSQRRSVFATSARSCSPKRRRKRKTATLIAPSVEPRRRAISATGDRGSVRSLPAPSPDPAQPPPKIAAPSPRLQEPSLPSPNYGSTTWVSRPASSASRATGQSQNASPGKCHFLTTSAYEPCLVHTYINHGRTVPLSSGRRPRSGHPEVPQRRCRKSSHGEKKILSAATPMVTITNITPITCSMAFSSRP